MLIMTFATKSLSSVPAGLTRFAVRGAAAVTTLVKAWIHRREILQLTELDERGLKDIGLVRSDVEGALASSWIDDPSAILAARSTARADVASARRQEGLRQEGLRQEGLRQDALKPVAAPRAQVVSGNTVACSA